jgi:peptide/nickel transport system ATP-binding protein
MTPADPTALQHSAPVAAAVPVVRAAGLTVADAAGRILLDAAGLELPAGRVTALVGRSGSGKTTLACALLGHLGPGLRRVAGAVDVLGHDPFTRDGRRAIRGRITGYVPQDPTAALDPRRTVLAQLRTADRIARPARAPRSDRAERIARAVADAALEPELLHRRPGQLSGGQAQRALLAWSLLIRPSLIVLDEPTSGLDPDTAHRVGATFAALPWHPAVLLVSHDRDLVGRLADHVVEMDAGALRPGRSDSDPAPERPAARGPGPLRAGAVLRVEGLTVRRGGSRVLDAVDMAVAEGELVAVRGASGSGKTTLARALCGLTEPDAGTVRWRGTRLPGSAAARVRAGAALLAYVGQDPRAALNPRETVRRTLARARAAADRNGRGGGDLPELLARFGLSAELLDRTPDRLSGGQRHRLVLARAVASAPAVLVCDETTAALDPAAEQHVLDALDLVRAGGVPVLFVTHRAAVAARADRTLTLDHGRLR